MSFLSGVGSALVGGATGLVGGVLGNYYNKKAAKKQNEYQWDFWNATNDYNSPASVMQRLEEAGLNPNLVYGNGGASYQATMPTAAKRAPADFNLGINATTFQQLENMEAQNDLIEQQGDNAKVQNRILAAQARLAEKDAEIYEKTGVRPGDTPIKSMWRSISDWFEETKFHRALEETRDWANNRPDDYGYSKNNSANVKFRD